MLKVPSEFTVPSFMGPRVETPLGACWDATYKSWPPNPAMPVMEIGNSCPREIIAGIETTCGLGKLLRQHCATVYVLGEVSREVMADVGFVFACVRKTTMKLPWSAQVPASKMYEKLPSPPAAPT